MASGARSALDGVEVLLIDGNNLLHRVAGSADPTAQRTLIPRLRNAIPSTIATVLMLDGHADTGTSYRERAGRGFEIRHSGSITADDALVRLIRDSPHAQRGGITIVTDDITLGNHARQMGAMTQRLKWLEQLLEEPPKRAAQIGAGSPPVQTAAQTAADEEEREAWRPGRGATRKRGNPRRSPRRAPRQSRG
jgi:hypothetical protein